MFRVARGGAAQAKPAKPELSMPIYTRREFWTCSNCDAEFRIDSGRKPICCPMCGVRRERPSDNLDIRFEPTLRSYKCPVCNLHIDIIKGHKPSACPGCGHDISPASA